MKNINLWACSFIVLMCLSLPSQADPAHSGMAASADSADTINSNPAGLARLEQKQLTVALVSGYSESEFSVGSTSSDLDGSSDNDGVIAIPSIYYAFPVNDKWTAGLSFNVPGGLGSDFGEDWLGRYFVQDWTLAYIGLTSAAGYKVNEKLSLGVGLTVTYVGYQIHSAVRNLEVGSSDGQMEINASDIGVGYSVGLLYNISDATRLGVTYHSEIESEVEGEPEFSGLGLGRREIVNQFELESKDIGIDTTKPQSVLMGLHHQFEGDLEWVADLLWLDFSEFGFSQVSMGDRSLSVEGSHYDDIYMASTAVTFPIAEKWRSGIGVLYASAGVDKDNRSFMLRLDRIFGVGVDFDYQWSKAKSVAFGVGYFDLGDAPVVTDELPLVGSIEGDFDKNQAISIDVSFNWLF